MAKNVPFELAAYSGVKELRGFKPNGFTTGIDWRKEGPGLCEPEGRKSVIQNLNDYFKDLREAANNPFGLYGAKTTRPGHIPGALPTTPDLDLRFYGPVVDNGIMEFFRFVDKTQSMNPTHQIGNVSAQAVVFEQAEEGQPARIRKVSGGTPITVSSVLYHGAVGIDDTAKRFDEFMIFEENVQRVPTIWDAKMAAVHTALFTALGAGVNETWVTDLITTLNNAGAKILEDCAEMYGLGDSPAFVLAYNHRNWIDVQQAMASNFTLPNNNNSAKALQWDITPVKTRRLPVNTFYLGLPGYDMVSIEWDALFSEYARDAMTGTDNFIWRSRRNAAIGNSAQVRRIVKP